MYLVSPHTRGWTRGLVLEHGGRAGFPAHAGMDPEFRSWRSTSERFPRTRGDGPPTNAAVVRQLWVSPHTRGWTLQLLRHPHRAGGFPAHAGMDPRAPSSRSGRRRFPRTRGDGPLREPLDVPEQEVSPHTRGWTREGVHHVHKPRGFPAHAGMDPYEKTSTPAASRFPRTRGDGPTSGRARSPARAVSPHTRGWTPGHHHRPPDQRGFPAHAGMDPKNGGTMSPAHGFPRTRGDGPCWGTDDDSTHEVSPHTRGWTRPLRSALEVREGFPAHAGMDPLPGGSAGGRHRFPRTRGDGPRPAALATLVHWV